MSKLQGRRARWLVSLAPFVAACGGGGAFPLTLEVKDGLVTEGRRPDELVLLVKTVPGAELTFEGQTRAVGDKASESFAVPKAGLKLGKNTLAVSGKRGVFLSKEDAKAEVSWEGSAKSFVRFVPTGGDGALGSLSCGGAMCGGTAFKIGKNGRVALDVESFVPGWITMGGRRESVTASGKKGFEIDVTGALGGLLLSQRDALVTPILFEVGSDKANETLTLTGPVLMELLATELARVSTAPVAFAKESPAPTSAVSRGVAVIGVPGQKLLVVGKPVKVEDLDWVAVAKPAERFFSCGGASKSANGIEYLDLEVSVFERRTARKLHEKKLMADRVACPNTPIAGAIKANVREADITRAVTEFMTPQPMRKVTLSQ